jgi:hypothetical protein
MAGAYIGSEINQNNRRAKGGLGSDRPIMISEIARIIAELASGGTGFLKADGSVDMTGLLNLSGDPVNPLNPVTKQYLEAVITALINGAPGTLNTLGELASAINNDPNFASNLSSQLSTITTDITNIKNYEFKILYYASINTASGAITKPTNTDIILSDFPQGYDAVVETIVNGEPTGEIAKTAGGVPITVTSFDISGNYTLSGTPSAFPVALLYVLKVKSQYMSNLTFDNIIESQNLSATAASNVTFTPNGDIASTNVQNAIQEVRDDTDNKLTAKQNLSEKDSSNGYVGLTLLKINFKNTANTFTSFLINAATAARNYVFPDRNITVAGVDDVYFILRLSNGAASPGDLQTLFFGPTLLIPTTVAANHQFKIGYDVVIVGAIITASLNTVQGSAEDSTMKINNLTTGVASTIGTFKTNAAPNQSAVSTTITGISIPIAATDNICGQWDTPTWVSNPTTVRPTLDLILRRA